MTLEGAKLICLDEAGNHGDIVLAKGRKFTMGYYVSCDFVLVDERAKGVHCEIECDAFGRVTIRNLSPDTPIVVNGSSVEIKRILLNNSKLSILDKEYLWLFSKNSSNEFEGVSVETSSTPVKYIGIPEQPPNSCPEFKPHRDCPKRFTVHNFAYCIQSDEEGNISLDLSEDVIGTKGSNESSSKTIDLVVLENNEGSSLTPQIVNEITKSRNEILDTPTMNIINCSKDKENGSTQKKNKQLLAMCHQSELVITSFSPRETGIKMLKSFATVIKPKGLNTKCPLTPKRVYNVPKSDVTVNANDQSMPDLISFYTPSTSKKGIESAASASTASSQVIKNSSMHLIDLTTPTKLKSSSPHLKSFMKTKNIPKKPSSDEQLDICELATAPEICEGSNSCSEVASLSLISVSSSTDISSVIEVTSDSSNIGVTSASATALNTPLKSQTRTGAFTPKKTPHSLMKRAILTSAKKQNITSHINTQTPNTPSRTIKNHKPLGSNLALLRTPQPSTGNLNKSQLPRRQSMSTPTRKNVPAITCFDNNPSTSKLSPACSSSKTSSRRSSLNPISAGEALTTSTPMSGLSHKSHIRRVLKISGGMPLPNHISKAYRSIPMTSSASNKTSAKKKSPQQIMSDRFVTRARNSLNFTPISTRSRNMVAASKRITASICPSSIIKESAMRSESKTETNKQPVDISKVDDLSRTFIIESDEDENNDDKIQQNVPKDATVSPERKLGGIEIPVDVEEVAEIPKENREHENENVKNINGKNISRLQQDNYVNNKTIGVDEKIKSIVTEESFAEVINDVQEQKNVSNDVDSTQKPLGDHHKDANVAEPGFGEESTIEMACSFGKKNIQYNRNGNENCLLIDREDYNHLDLQSTSISKIECDPKNEIDVEINNEKNKTVLEETSEEEMKSEHVEAVEFNIKEETQYKPIVEDITLEGSLIQKDKDAQESDGIVEDITLKGSVIEKDKATQKSEQNEETILCNQPSYEKTPLEGLQVKEKVQDENTDNEVFSTTSLSKLQHFYMIDESNTEQKDEIPAYSNQSGLIELELRPFNKSEPAEQPQDKQSELQYSFDTSSKEIKNQIDSQIFDKNVEEIAEESKPTDDIKITESESQSATETEVRNDGNMEDTNKLLEQIEDVLNKSDEIQQKHLSEVEHSTDMPLTEELATERFSEEKVSEIEETEVSKKFATEEHKLKNLSDDKFAEIEKSEKHDKHVSKLVKHQESSDQKVQRNEDASLQQQQKSDVNMEEKSQASSKKTFELDISKIQSILTSKEHPEFGDGELKILDNNLSRLKDHACDVGNSKLCVQENFNENAERIAENIISNKNLSDLANCESEKTTNNDKNEGIIEKVEILNLKNSVDFNICDKTSTFITHNDDIEENNKVVNLNKITEDIPYENFNKNNSVNDKNSDRMFQLHTEDEVIDFTQQDENIEDTNPHNVCFENITAGKDSNKDFNNTHTLSEKELNIDVIEMEQNSQRAEGNKAENIVRKEFNAGNQKLEISKEFTPRRSSRRASQTENTVQPSVELILTPRRSTRRASLSGELAVTLTPSKRTFRRASSVVTETPLTPKSVTKRRISSFVDDDKPSTSKLANTQIARKQFEKSMLLLEEMDEEIDTKEELSLRKVQFGEKRGQSSILQDDDNFSPAILAPEDIKLDTQLKETVILPNSIDDDVVVISSEEIELETEQFDNKHEMQLMPEENSEKLWQTDLPHTLTELEEHTNTSSSSSTRDWNVNSPLDVAHNSENQNKQEIKASSPEKQPEELAKDIDVLISKERADIDLVLTEMILIHDSDSEVSQPANEANIKTVVSKDNPTATEDNEDFVKVQECANDDLEKSEIRKAEDFLERKANKSQVEVLSTGASTPRFDGLRDMMRTPKESLESVEKEYEKLADGDVLVKTPEPTISEIPRPKSNNVKSIDDSSKTPLVASSHKLLKTPKTETPQIEDICDLALPPKDIGETIVMTSVIKRSTPKLARAHNLTQIHKSIDIEEEQFEKLSKSSEHIIDDEMPSSSMQNYNLKGVKDPLKTSINVTPGFQGVQELKQPPKKNSSPTMTDLKELLETSTASETQDISTEENLVSAISEDVINLKNVKELLKTPKRCSTPHFKGLKELMLTPKISSSPSLVGIKELMGTTTQPKHHELDKFLRTPAAKNIMIPSMPSSAVIEKSDNSIEVSTEYDLNATNVGEATNLEELFKTPMSSHFDERITPSYYSEDVERQGEIEEQFTELTSVSLQDTLSKTAEEAFDKLVGQETQFQTPIRKQYTRKSITLKTDQSQSPFSAADVLSDLPKTDVEEWIETLEEAEPPIIIDCDDKEVEYEVKKDKINESVNEVGGVVSTPKYSLKQGNISFNESIIPETCAKVYLTENKFETKNSASSSCTDTKDPLANTAKEVEIVVSNSPDTSCRAEISGINLLDETFETLGSETSMLDEALVVEEPSMFEDALVVSDNESEAECKLNYVGKCGILQYEGDDLSEPLLVSDSEDISNSQKTVSNEIVKAENVCEVNENNDEDSQTSSNFDVDVQDKSMIDECSDMGFTMKEDPLETEHKGKSFVNSARKSELKTDYKQISIGTAREDKTFNEYDISQSQTNFDGEEISKDNELYSKGKNHLTQENKQSEICENIEEDIIEVFSGSKVATTPKDASADLKESSKNPTITIDSDSEIDAIEGLSNSGQSGNVDIGNKNEKQFTSNVSDDIFVDDVSASESCEEIKEDEAENKQHSIMTYDECQDIFIDNSNITEENEAVLSKVSAKADNENNRNNIAEKEIGICDIAQTCAVVSKCIKENEIAINEEVLTKQEQGRSPQTNMCENMDIDYNPYIISPDLCPATETMYCLQTELPQHIEAQKSSAVESKASEILLSEQESVDANTIEFALNKTNRMPNIADTDIGQTTALAFENLKETEGELNPETKEIFNKSVIDSSADLILADKSEPKPIKCSEQDSLETQHDKSANDVSIQHFEINISQTSEKSLKEGDCISEDIHPQVTGCANSEDHLRVSVENLQPLNEISKDLEKTFECGPPTSTTKYSSIAENYKQHKIIDKEPTATLEVFENEEIISGDACSVNLTPSVEIIKYDFEIQINDIDDKTKELPTSSKSSKNADPYYELSTVEGISEESTTTLKSLEVSEESAEGKTISTSSQQSKVVSEKLENIENIQVMKQGTLFTVQESEKSDRKRTQSESSQGTFKDNDNRTRTSREDRRKVEKSPFKDTVLERKECEELIVQKVLQVDITKLVVTSEEISNMSEINKQIPCTEAKPDDKLHIAEDVLVEAHKKILADENITQGKQSPQMETSAQDVHVSEQKKGEEQSESDALTGKGRHAEENEMKQSEEEFLPDIHSPSTSENYNNLATESHMLTCEIITPSEFHVSRDKEQHLSENRIKEDLINSTASEETTLGDISKTAVASHNIEKVNEEKILQKPSDHGNKLPNIIEISVPKDGANVKGILALGGEVYTVVERKKSHIGKRSRRKGAAVSESTKNLVIEDVKTSDTMSRRKAQKTPAEEDAPEDIKDDEVASTTVTSIESSKANLEGGKIANDDKEQEHINFTDDQIMEIQQQTRKRGRPNANVSESSQGSINEDDTSRTRRGRRKVTKTPIEKIVLEEKVAGKSKDLSIFNKVELEAEQNTFEQKHVPVLAEITEVTPNEAVVELQYDRTSKPEENSKHQVESKAREISKGRTENVESKQITSRRGRSKQTSLETVLEEPTTSRKSRRKLKVSNTESKLTIHPDINKQVEDVNVAAIEMPVVDKVSAQQINEEAEIVKRGRHGKANIKDIGTETVSHKEISFPNSSEFIISDTKTVEQNITKELPDEQDKKEYLPNMLPVQKTSENAEQDVEHTTKYSARRLRAVKKQTTNQLTELDDSHREETSSKRTIVASPQTQRNDEPVKIDSEFVGKHQKSTRRRQAVADKQYDKHQEELLPKTRKRRIKQDECENLTKAENLTEDSLLSNVKVTDVNIEHPHSSQQLTNAGEKNQEIKTGRREPISESDDILNTSKRRAVTKHISEDNKASIPAIKTRVSRRKQIGEKQEAVIKPVVNNESEKKNDKNLADNSETSSTIDRKQKKHEVLQTTHIENSGDTNEETELKGNRDNEQPREGIKKLRSKTKKIDHQKEEVPTISHSDIRDTTSKDSIQSDRKLVAESDTYVDISSTNAESQTPQRKFPVSRKGRKQFEHITAESQEIEDTPGRRARNVPQRRAATAYHNYDETSDSEISTKALQKTETPRKYLEAAKKSPTTTTTSSPSASISPSPATVGLITTTRGRTRKPTAKVQQFLEEERAKAETPKRRALLAAAAVAEAATPQRTPARRGRKPSTIETEVEGISKSNKKSGRAKPSTSSTKEKDTNVDSETIPVLEKTESQLQVTPIPPNIVKAHRGGRKAKITEEKQQISDEIPAKKTLLELQNEKLNSPFSGEVATPPTRVAGKRNAAAAAKARIEEDALAAAAIEPPKRSRGKKAITKVVSTPVSVITDRDPQSFSLEQEHSPKLEKEVKDKVSGESREHRLASVSTVESIEDLQKEIEVETGEKPGNKKRRKATASVKTNSPTVPVKRSRKAKLIEEVADTNNAGDSQTTRSRGRGRKNIHFNEHHEAAETSSNQQNASDGTSVPTGDTSEPVKKGTRTRRK